MSAKIKIAKVLIADNDPQWSGNLGTGLTDAGFEVSLAKDGHEALEKFRRHLPDCVILDFTLSKVDAVKVCQSVRAAGGARPPVIIFLSHLPREALTADIHKLANAMLPKMEMKETLGKLLWTLHELTGEPAGTVKGLKKADYSTPPAPPIENTALSAELSEANQRLQEANMELSKAYQMKSEFVANMSHELRSPLNDILGFTQLVLGRTYGEINPRVEEAVSLISESAHTLLELINAILDLSKLEAGEKSISFDAFSGAELLEEIFKVTGPLVRGKPIKMRLDLEKDLPILYSDRGKIRQIMMNLVHNAIKFTKRGSIKITAKTNMAEQTVEITVEDTGIGIDKKDQDIIFEAFRQVDGSSTREFGGTGLGLAITKKLLDVVGGTISVKSALGVGSTFRVVFPILLEKKLVQELS